MSKIGKKDVDSSLKDDLIVYESVFANNTCMIVYECFDAPEKSTSTIVGTGTH